MTMRLSIILAVVVLVVVADVSIEASTIATAITSDYDFDCDQQFALFVLKFERQYATDEQRANAREIFCRKHATAVRLNNEQEATGLHGNKAKFSAFTKLGDVELVGNKKAFQRNAVTLKEPSNSAALKEALLAPVAEIPKTRDWRKDGAVTPVWNEGQCGSTWSFPLLDNIAALWYLNKKGPLTQLSAQEIVSCATDGNQGCEGGYPWEALDYIMTALNGSILTNASFPYNSGDGNPPPCRTTGTIGATIKGWAYVDANEELFAQYVGNTAPLAVDIDAESLSTYTGGILSGSAACSYSNIDHCVTLVGYDDTHNPPYWIARNMWGTDWGEGGYFRMAKGVNCLDVASFNATVAFV